MKSSNKQLQEKAVKVNTLPKNEQKAIHDVMMSKMLKAGFAIEVDVRT